MYLKFKGTQTHNLENNLDEVVQSMIERCGLDRFTPYRLQDVECKVQFQVDGKWVYVSGVHTKEDGTEFEEMLEVSVKLDMDGNIDTTVDTEYNPVIDETMQKLIAGNYNYSEIQTQYTKEEIEQIDILEAEDLRAIRYKVLEDEGFELVRYYKGDMLVFEMEVTTDWNTATTTEEVLPDGQ